MKTKDELVANTLEVTICDGSGITTQAGNIAWGILDDGSVHLHIFDPEICATIPAKETMFLIADLVEHTCFRAIDNLESKGNKQ